MSKKSYFIVIFTIVIILVFFSGLSYLIRVNGKLEGYESVVHNLELEKTQLQIGLDSKADEILQLMNKIEQIELDLDEKSTMLDDAKDEIDYLLKVREEQVLLDNSIRDTMTYLSEVVHTFIIARRDGNFDVLRSLISDDFELVDNGTEILLLDREFAYDLPIHIYEKSELYIDKVIRTSWYDQNTDTYYFNVIEYYDGDVGGIAFVNLSFKKLEEGWKVVGIEFDI